MKRFLVSLAILLFVPLSVSASSFMDISEGDKYYTAIDWLERNQIVVGYDLYSDQGLLLGQEFRPQQAVTRAEFAKMLYRTKGFESTSLDFINLPWDDVVDGEWYQPYLKYGYINEDFSGYDDGTFGPDRNIALDEALKIVTRAYFDVDQYDTTHDYSVACEGYDLREYLPDEHWGWKYFKIAQQLCIFPDQEMFGSDTFYDNFAYDYNITRGDMAELIYRSQAIHDLRVDEVDPGVDGEEEIVYPLYWDTGGPRDIIVEEVVNECAEWDGESYLEYNEETGQNETYCVFNEIYTCSETQILADECIFIDATI